MKTTRYILTALLLSLFFCSHAQERLTTQQAIAEFLENNYDLKIAQNAVQRAEVNASEAAVGYYPTVQLNAGVNGDYGGARQEFQNGDKIEAMANLTQVYNASIGVNYNIYQGGERKISLQRLNQEIDRMEIQEKATAERQMTELLIQYYRAAEAEEQMQLLQELVSFSEERLQRSETNLQYGRGSRLDVTNAKVDLQRDEANLINARMTHDQELRLLLQIMGREEMRTDVTLDNQLDYDLALNQDELLEMALNRNLDLSLLQAELELLDYDAQLLDAQRKPVLGFSAEYAYRFQDFGQGAFFAQQRSNGIGGGLNLSWQLYDGGRVKQQRELLEVQETENRLQEEQVKQQIQTQLLNLYGNYLAALELQEVEKQSIQASREAFEQSREEYNLGRLGQIEYRQAQINLRNAELAERRAAYSAKILEVQISQITGILRAQYLQ